VYRDRYGRLVLLWCNPSNTYQWISIGSPCGFTYSDDGRRNYGMRSSGDIVAYVGPLPVDVLQRMREALALAEGDEPQSPTVDQRLRHKCSVCGEWPNERGVLHHGRGCYVPNKGGGGCTYVDFEKEPKQ
jgi:hypothetical protein